MWLGIVLRFETGSQFLEGIKGAISFHLSEAQLFIDTIYLKRLPTKFKILQLGRKKGVIMEW